MGYSFYPARILSPVGSGNVSEIGVMTVMRSLLANSELAMPAELPTAVDSRVEQPVVLGSSMTSSERLVAAECDEVAAEW